jgi:thioredoxin
LATKEMTSKALDEAVADNDLVLVDFWAPWCAPCVRFAPIFEASSQAHPGVVFGKVNTEDQHELAAAAGISSIPTLVAFKSGTVIYRKSGAVAAPELERLIQSFAEVDLLGFHARSLRGAFVRWRMRRARVFERP